MEEGGDLKQKASGRKRNEDGRADNTQEAQMEKRGGEGGEDKINKYGRANTGRRRVRRRSGAEGGISSVEMRGTRM